jgi:hypothetical protein
MKNIIVFSKYMVILHGFWTLPGIKVHTIAQPPVTAFADAGLATIHPTFSTIRTIALHFKNREDLVIQDFTLSKPTMRYHLALRGGGARRSNIHRRSKRKPKGVDKLRKSKRIHGLIRPHDAKHDDERRYKRRLQEKLELNETSVEEHDAAFSDAEHPRPKKERPLRLGERTIGQIMNTIHNFKLSNPEVFEEERNIMIDNEAYLMVPSTRPYIHHPG